MDAGSEWIVDASGCDPRRLADLPAVAGVCKDVIEGLGLLVLGAPVWHRFPGPGGVTGLYLLTESHLACHTFPEHGLATFNLYCCRPRRRWDWQAHLARRLGARHVLVRMVPRGVAAGPAPLAAAEVGGAAEAGGAAG